MAKVVNLGKQKKGKTDRKSRFDIIAYNREKRGKHANKFKKELPSKKRLKKKLLKIFLVLCTIGLFVGLIGAVYAFSYIQKLDQDLPSVDEPFGPKPSVSIIYDRNNGVLSRVFSEFDADPVNIQQIPDVVKWAFLAGEDREFYKHKGVDVKHNLLCLVQYLKSRAVVCGGSTITQQMLKNTVFQNETPLKRKVKEILLATKLEQAYSKDEILQLYLTVTGYGSNIVGVETASKFYFGVPAKKLTLAQAAILASIVNDPSYLSPTVPVDGDLERAQADVKQRQQYILNQIDEHLQEINDQIRKNLNKPDLPDTFTKESIQAARDEKIVYRAPIANDKKAGHFVDYVMNQLQTKNYKNGEEPFTIQELQTGGYKIQTSLDYKQQKLAEQKVKFAGNAYDYWNGHNAALMTIDPSNGEILAMAGSKDYFGAKSQGCDSKGKHCKYDPQVNVLTSLNEPGSTNKPLGYTIAFDEGKLFGGSNIPDVPISFGELNYSPKNWNGGYHGARYTVKQALNDSENIPALQTITLIGVDKYVEFAQKLGYTTYDPTQVGPSIMLGGASVKYTEHINAYAAFANEGNYIPIDPILKITDKDGKVVYEAKPKKKQVLNQQAVYMLDQVIDNYGNMAVKSGITLSCKTGTTESNTEALEICWNNNLVSLAWVGNNNNSPLDQNYGYPIFMIDPWFSDYLNKISKMDYYKGKDPHIKRPGYLYQTNGCSGTTNCAAARSDWQIQGKAAPTYLEIKSFIVCTDQPDHLARDIDISLGKSVKKKITRVISPNARWQGAVDKYVKSHGGINTYPKDNCTIDRTGGIPGPIFNITSPTNGSTVSGSINAKGTVITTTGNINSLNFKLDGQNIGSTTTYSGFDVNLDISSLGLDNGTYQFSATATDTDGNTKTATVSVVVNSTISSNFSFTNMPPSPLVFGLTVGPSAPTYNIQVKYTGGGASNVQLYQLKNGGSKVLLGTMSPGGGNTFDYTWGAGVTGAGSYTFYVTASIGNTGTTQSTTSSAVQVN